MKRTLSIVLIVLVASSACSHAQVVDDFSEGGWARFESTPGTMSAEAGKLHLKDGPGPRLRVLLQESCPARAFRALPQEGRGVAEGVRAGLRERRRHVPGQHRRLGRGHVVSRNAATVVERCYIHDPVSKANPWYYSHPAGPQAVGMDKPRSTVVRYNDFIGSDQHRWNDAVEGAGNFHLDGGFNRDADIYGNLMCYANDGSPRAAQWFA